MTSLRLEGRSAVVTGAGRGLGRAIALAFAEAGADVVLAGRSADALEAVAAEVRERGRRALVCPTDVTDGDQVEALMAATEEAFGRLDVLVNNSGVVASSPLIEMTDAQWDSVMDTNLRGTFLCLRAAGRRLVTSGGKVINIASNWGLMGVPQFSSYCASKAGLISLTRVAALEWARHGVQVNAIAPGYFETDINAEVRGQDDVRDRVVRQIPAGRMGLPQEIGPLAVFLASADSDFMTGETVVIDGGQVAR